jgi:hypothetical protein
MNSYGGGMMSGLGGMQSYPGGFGGGWQRPQPRATTTYETQPLMMQ